MKTYLLNQGLYTKDSFGNDSATGPVVMARAIEIATNDKRPAIELSADDWQRAKRELSDKTE